AAVHPREVGERGDRLGTPVGVLDRDDGHEVGPGPADRLERAGVRETPGLARGRAEPSTDRDLEAGGGEHRRDGVDGADLEGLREVRPGQRPGDLTPVPTRQDVRFAGPVGAVRARPGGYRGAPAAHGLLRSTRVPGGRQPTETTGEPACASFSGVGISLAIRIASSMRVSTIIASGTVLMTSPLTKIWPLPLPDATPRSASRASPGPLTTQPMTATRSGTVMPSSPAVTFSASV